VSTRILLWSIAVALGTPVSVRAQAVSGWTESSGAIGQVPEPVRRTPAPRGNSPLQESNAPLVVSESRSNVMNDRLVNRPTPASEIHAHPVINGKPIRVHRNPRLQPHQLLVSPARQAPHNQRTSSRSNWSHHFHQKHHKAIQPPSALLPEANGRPTWKTPYSYGYFGASRTKHWNIHYGYRDQMTEWRLR
jgi:hypothetical protein